MCRFFIFSFSFIIITLVNTFAECRASIITTASTQNTTASATTSFSTKTNILLPLTDIGALAGGLPFNPQVSAIQSIDTYIGPLSYGPGGATNELDLLWTSLGKNNVGANGSFSSTMLYQFTLTIPYTYSFTGVGTTIGESILNGPSSSFVLNSTGVLPAGNYTLSLAQSPNGVSGGAHLILGDVIPEPSSIAAAICGIIGLAIWRSRKNT
jgi:hypothetical protein